MEISRRIFIGAHNARMVIDQDTCALAIEGDMVHTGQWLLDIHALLQHAIVAKGDAVAVVSVVEIVRRDIAREIALHLIRSVQIAPAEDVSEAAVVFFARSVV